MCFSLFVYGILGISLIRLRLCDKIIFRSMCLLHINYKASSKSLCQGLFRVNLKWVQLEREDITQPNKNTAAAAIWLVELVVAKQ